jgi:hypothetical protein
MFMGLKQGTINTQIPMSSLNDPWEDMTDNGDVQGLKDLKDRGVYVDLARGPYLTGNAAAGNNLKALEWLWEHMGHPDTMGQMWLGLTACNNYIDVMDFVLDHFPKSDFGGAMVTAADAGLVDMTRMLFNRGDPSPEEVNFAAKAACETNNIELVRIFYPDWPDDPRAIALLRDTIIYFKGAQFDERIDDLRSVFFV